jgi:lantibiotic modifying enzyme
MDRVNSICNLLLERAEWDAGAAYWLANSIQPRGERFIGLHMGSAGIGLFLAYAYSITGEIKLLHTALGALRHDLGFARLNRSSIGFPRVSSGEDGAVVYPYLEVGTAGILAAALRILKLSREAWVEDFVHEALPTIFQKYTVFAGLGQGLSGLTNSLLDASIHLSRPDLLDQAWLSAGGLLHFRVGAGDIAATPAQHGGVISSTYLHGCSGVALVLNRLIDSRSSFHFSLDELL